MQKLLLTSAGFENPKVWKELLRIANKPAKEIRILYIPTAAKAEKAQSYVELYRQELMNLGISKSNLSVLEIDRRVNYQSIGDFDVMYMGGGNTFYLLHQIKKFDFDKLIRKFVGAGKVYFGVSAGSYIACPTIEAAAWKPADINTIGLEDLTALNFVPFLMTAHYRPEYKKVIDAAEKKTQYEVRRLTDNQALLVTGSKVKLIE